MQAVLRASSLTLPVPCPACYDSWKGAAASYLDVGGQLLAQLQSEEGGVLTEQLLTQVAVAREALEKADVAYNKALDKLEVGEAAQCTFEWQPMQRLPCAPAIHSSWKPDASVAQA